MESRNNQSISANHSTVLIILMTSNYLSTAPTFQPRSRYRYVDSTLLTGDHFEEYQAY